MPSGLVPLDFGGETNDHGEESYYRAKMLARALRRLDRWEGGKAAPRGRPKGERSSNPAGAADVRPVMDSGDEDEDEDLMDVDELERREAEDASEDESDDEGGANGDWDPHTLPPLPRMA
ncbi:hypothetical protein CFE70_005652 [Pyrenophora teres f. teres 0-1]